MQRNTRFSFLAKQLVSLVDAGKKLDMDHTHAHIRDNTLFDWLAEKYPDRINLSDIAGNDLEYMGEQFKSWSHVVDERRKMEVEYNGLCLLIAYCLEAIEGDPNTIQTQEPIE